MWKILSIVTFFLMAGLFVLLTVIDGGLYRKTGYNSLSLQLKTEIPVAQKVLDSWGPEAKKTAETSLAVDFAFMFLGYGAFFFCIGRLLKSNALAFHAMLPVVFDSTENLMHLTAIVGSRPELVTASFFISVIKFFFFALYLVLLSVLLIRRLIQKREKNA